jgi:prevent-host-death family protein
MAYTVHQAKTHFSRLLKEAEAGQEVIVMRGSKPVAKLVPIEANSPEPEVPLRLAGAYRDKISWTEDAFGPMTDQELIDNGWGYMLERPLVPSVSPSTEPESGK